MKITTGLEIAIFEAFQKTEAYKTVIKGADVLPYFRQGFIAGVEDMQNPLGEYDPNEKKPPLKEIMDKKRNGVKLGFSCHLRDKDGDIYQRCIILHSSQNEGFLMKFEDLDQYDDFIERLQYMRKEISENIE